MPRSKTEVSGRAIKQGPSEGGGSLPKWAQDEVKSVQFGKPEIATRSGYILDIYETDYKIDIQVYEPLSDGRTIVEGLDVPKNLKISGFLKGFIYEFRIRVSKAALSSKLTELLKSKYNLDMNTLYRFELEDLQIMDVESDIQISVNTMTADDEGD